MTNPAPKPRPVASKPVVPALTRAGTGVPPASRPGVEAQASGASSVKSFDGPRRLETARDLLAAMLTAPDWAVFLDEPAQERWFKLPAGSTIQGEEIPESGVVIASILEGGISWYAEEALRLTGDEAVGPFLAMPETATMEERVELLSGL